MRQKLPEPPETNRPTSMSRRHPLAIFFALAYGISWLLWAPLWLPAFGVDGLPTLPFHHALGALGPIAAAFLVSAAETGLAGPGVSYGAWACGAGGSLLLTLGWALWHAPLFFYRPGYTSMNAADIAGWFFSLATGALLLTWLYNGSQGSILVVALFHAVVDEAFTSDISSPFVVNAAGALITVWGMIVLVAAGLGYLSWRGKMVRLYDGSAVTGFVHRDGQVGPTASQRE